MREAPSGRGSTWARFRRRLRSRRVRVVDESMVPTLRPGDRLLVDLGAYRGRLPSPGEVVVAPDPQGRVRWLVKRVTAVNPTAGTIELAGDTGGPSRDSRSFGPVPIGSVLGRAYRLYAPLDRQREL